MPHSDHTTPSLSRSPSGTPEPDPPVQPDHFYSADADDAAHALSPPSSPSSMGRTWLSPDDDPLATKGIPVFKPTMDEFADFEAYMNRVECWGMRSGIVKIIPPREWSDALPPVREQLRHVRIKSPIEQVMLGRSGLFRQQNIEKRKALSVREWAELCGKEDFRAPAVDEVGLKAGGEHVFDRRVRRTRKRDTSEEKVDIQLTVVKDEADEDQVLEDAGVQVETPGQDRKPSGEDDEDDAPHEAIPLQGKKRRFQTRAEKDAALARRAELDDKFLDTFDPAMAWLPRSTIPGDYTPAFCNTLERRFWRNCGLGRSAWYGADTEGSLFTEDTTAWNVGCLPSTLSRLLPASGKGLPGVNSPYLYFGMWRATFAWHVEDMDLFSINYIHFGAPKFWYAMPQGRAVQLENTMRGYFPSDVAGCRQFLRHKSFLASPTLLAKSACKPNICVQHAGEFIVTFPRGYHAGFNLGFNCAESVNFALDSWIDIGRKAQACGCIGDSVRINVDELLALRQEEEEREELEKAAKAVSSAQNSSRKRKSDGSGKPKSKKMKKHTHAEPKSAPSSSATSNSTTQKIVLKVPKDFGPFPCCLCISLDHAGLLRVHDLPQLRAGCQNYLPKDPDGNEIWKAHETCAKLVPETWLDEIQGIDGNMERVVFGVDTIVKDRWALKCSHCQKPRAKLHGAPIQCTKGKCPKAFHISCARNSGPESKVYFAELQEVEKEVILNDQFPAATVDVGEQAVPPAAATMEVLIDDDAAKGGDSAPTLSQINVAKTIKKMEYELLCNQHNPAVAALKRANKLDRVRRELLGLPAMSRIKLRVSAGVFEVSLMSVNEERGTVEVIWDDGHLREFKWSSLVWGNLDGQTVGQKPTVAAPKVDKFHVYSNLPQNPPSASSTPISETQHYGGSGYGAFQPIPMYQSANSLINTHPQFGSGSYSYYSYPTYPGPAYPYAHQPPVTFPIPSYPYYGSPPLGPTSWPSAPPASSPAPPPMYSLLNPLKSSGAPPPFSDTLRQTVAASVASLPFRAGLTEQRPLSSNSGQQSPAVEDRQATVSSEAKDSEAAVSSNLPSTSPDVLRAIEEIQAFSSLDKDRLVEVMRAQPSLREAMNVILAHSASVSS